MPNSHGYDLERIAEFPLVGIDGEGCRHRFDWYDDVVIVLAPEETTVRWTEPLPAGALPRWVEHVRAERGWRECRYVQDGWAHLAERLAAAVEGEG